YPLGDRATIGRQNTNTIPIAASIISRNHGEIAWVNGTYCYRDLDSTNGTYVNGTLLGKCSPSGQRATKLNDGDLLCFDFPQNKQSHPECVYALFALHYQEKGEWSTLPLTGDIAEICVGRSVQSGLQITDDTISERHASFFSSSNGWAIIDHQSTNGVYINGKKMSVPRYLEPFDVIRIVNTYFIFTGEQLLYSKGNARLAGEQPPIKQAIHASPQKEAPSPVSPQPVAVSNPPILPQSSVVSQGELVIYIVERSVMQRFKKMLLLQDIHLTVSYGEMVLILGGSGAGKTTFINAVMGYVKASGKILYRDTDIYAEYEQMKYDIGFVPQQDLVRGSDTVYDTLSNAAEMKLPKRITFEEREERIKKVLDELGLIRERETLVSKLSGGQRKRLSIAVELIANPSLFFLDEPDSGVDDVIGRGLMENLRLIANQGKIVMVITHSPERATDLFDKVIVLAKSTKDNCGHLAFFGSVEEAFRFFEVSCFREIVKKINRPDENGEGLSDYYIDKYATYSKR
ncbi:MAG: FHA domain-containing protein, partial [Clostridia bacterium]|nr:FHA domain-containing protein [Clostridia bacterium]